jgi:hypothetical protein
VDFCACLAWHFYEIDAHLQFLTDGFETTMAPSEEIIYPTLEALALIEPGFDVAAPSVLSAIAAAPSTYNIIITAQPHGSIPTNLWGSSYLVFMDSL